MPAEALDVLDPLGDDEPDVIVAARRGSPLIIGVGQGEHILASDAAAVLGEGLLEPRLVGVGSRRHLEVVSRSARAVGHVEAPQLDALEHADVGQDRVHAAPGIQVAPMGIDFGRVAVGDTATRMLRISNPGYLEISGF